MKESNSKTRIKELMQYYGINQTELCRRTGIQKSALSNYLNGDREPRQDQISLLCDPFGVNPAWLMGYDVPMHISSADKDDDSERITKALKILDMIENLPSDNQKMILSFLDNYKADS